MGFHFDKSTRERLERILKAGPYAHGTIVSIEHAINCYHEDSAEPDWTAAERAKRRQSFEAVRRHARALDDSLGEFSKEHWDEPTPAETSGRSMRSQLRSLIDLSSREIAHLSKRGPRTDGSTRVLVMRVASALTNDGWVNAPDAYRLTTTPEGTFWKVVRIVFQTVKGKAPKDLGPYLALGQRSEKDAKRMGGAVQRSRGRTTPSDVTT